MKTLILYFSGTGNTKYVAEKISGALREWNHKTEIYSIEEKVKIIPEEYDRVILGCPKYYEYPVLDFITYLKNYLPHSNKKIPVFIYCTQAGPLGTNFKPIEKILRKKNYYITVSRSFPVSNNMVIFQTFPLTSQEKIQDNLEKIEEELKPLLQNFMKGKRQKEQINPVLGAICHLTGVVFTKLFPVFGMKYSASKACTGCGLCAKKCPRINIIMKDNRPQFGHKCIFCMRCIIICPGNAIMYNKKQCEQYKEIHKNQF
jgi:Flavodoxin